MRDGYYGGVIRYKEVEKLAKLQLSIALAVSEQRTYNQTIKDGALDNLTRLILEGAVIPDGIDLIPSDVYSGELIWRQHRSA